MATTRSRAARYLLLAALLLLALAPLAGRAQTAAGQSPQPQMTSDQAIQVARDFCRKIGKPVTGHGEAVFSLTGFENECYWLPQWRVRLSDQAGLEAEVHVVDAVGVVAYYMDWHYSKVIDSTPPGQPLPPEQAEQRGLALFRASEEQEDLGHLTATLQTIDPHPTARDVFYLVELERMFHGVPYLHEGASALLNSETGEVYIMHLHLSSPPMAADQAPLAQGAALPQEQAVAATQAHLVYDLGLGGAGLGGAALRDATLKVVTVPVGPDTGQAPQPKVGRVAWVVRYSGQNWEDDVWVDAGTGQVVGEEPASGGYGGPKAPLVPPSLSLRTVLPGLRAVYARRADAAAKRGWAPAKSAALTEKGQSKLLADLRAAKPLKDAPAGPPPAQLALVGKDDALGIYSYYPDSGALGAGQDWVSVPKSVKEWLRAQMADAGTGKK